MFNRKSSTYPLTSTRIVLVLGLIACLAWLGVLFFRGSISDTNGKLAARSKDFTNQDSGAGTLKLQGEQAQNYLEQTSEGQSLMRTLTTSRFGLERREKSPFKDDKTAGYLGINHDENLNAWFDNEGVTIRPTLPEAKRTTAWQMRMRLKSYGYGEDLHEAETVVAGVAKDNRIEYQRDASRSVVEWYVNRSEGIEQGFTLNQRPLRNSEVPGEEPLRLVVSVTGDLQARATKDGQAVEMNRGSEGVLTYSKLIAVDAAGKNLPARMETNEAGNEVALVVDDAAAVYPIVVDPITATQSQALQAGSRSQSEARFGFAVAMDGSLAVVGAWREDIGMAVDQGAIYVFVRGTNWTLDGRLTPAVDSSGSPQCGWSVAIHGQRFVAGCPGFLNSRGFAVLYRWSGSGFFPSLEIEPNIAQGDGDRFGESVAIGEGPNFHTDVMVGAPMKDFNGLTDTGTVLFARYSSDFVFELSSEQPSRGTPANNSHYGMSVALDNGTAVASKEGGSAHVFRRSATGGYELLTNVVGENQASPTGFGSRVAVSGDNVVVSAPLFDTTAGADAGAVYAYDLRQVDRQVDPLINFLTGQRLTGSDTKPGDFFGTHAVAIEGNTLVVGAFGNGQGGDPLNGIPDDDRGAAYIFTRSNGVWSQQTKISQNNFQGGEAGDQFGIDVDISGARVIIGARGASAGAIPREGEAFIYDLNCTAPYGVVAFSSVGIGNPACPGTTVSLGVLHDGINSPVSYQWRKNEENIPGATGAVHSLTNISASDVGIYDVIVSTACGTQTSTSIFVNVHTLNINPTSQNFAAAGSNGIVNVTSTGSSCGWTAASNNSWLNITTGASGTGNGTVGFTIGANTGAQRTGSLTIAGKTFTVTQDGVTAGPTFQFSQSTYSTSEGASGATITVTRSGNLSSAATVEYATTDGTATDRGDYNTTIGRLRFASGEAAKNFTVLLNDDAYVEGAESLTLALSNPSSGTSIGSPSIATLSIVDNDSTTSSVNPLNSTTFFVRQHYVDFLSREPDGPGLSFWTNNIDSCGANTGCREVKRIDTSAAFFLSIEFQETGFLVHRFYRAAFNRLARYREFIRDSQELGRGLVVNSPGWEAVLEGNKQAFTSEFAARADFQSLYNSMTNAQYVDTLNSNTGNSLSTTERNALVNGLNGGTETRATVLRKVAEDADFRARETSPAFVLMQYFGYLRRNPDDPPEPGLNFNGYNFWLNKLNSFGGDFRAAEMVKAFIISTEYRARFGQP